MVGCLGGLFTSCGLGGAVGTKSLICGILCANTMAVGTGTNCKSEFGAVVGV